MPVIRRQMSEAQQWEIVWHLLFDQEAEDIRWHLQWIIDYLGAREQQFLAELTAHCQASFPGEKAI